MDNLSRTEAQARAIDSHVFNVKRTLGDAADKLKGFMHKKKDDKKDEPIGAAAGSVASTASSKQLEMRASPFIRVGMENSTPISLYYEDHGAAGGQPIVMIHGWPLSGVSWEKQMSALLPRGFRVITYDRRGFGKSSKPASGYDYDTFASDLNVLLTELDLNNVVLVGFSMGGGELARYMGKFGGKRIAKLVFVDCLAPSLKKADDNPTGADAAFFDGFSRGLAADRYATFRDFVKNCFNTDVLGKDRMSADAAEAHFQVCCASSAIAAAGCVSAWQEDFRHDVSTISCPTLIVHGTEDRICPIEATGRRAHQMIKGSQLVELKGAPHGSNWTHSEEVNAALLAFLKDDIR